MMIYINTKETESDSESVSVSEKGSKAGGFGNLTPTPHFIVIIILHKI